MDELFLPEKKSIQVNNKEYTETALFEIEYCINTPNLLVFTLHLLNNTTVDKYKYTIKISKTCFWNEVYQPYKITDQDLIGKKLVLPLLKVIYPKMNLYLLKL